VAENNNLTVLYMEDDAGIARLVQKALERNGYLVEIATNGAEGLARVEQGNVDVLIVDYSMPVYGGIDVIKVLEGNPASPPIIMLTGHGNEKVAVEALKSGAADYIVKDVNMGFLELLPAVVEQVVVKNQLVRDRSLMFDAIAEREERYRRLVELSPDGIAIIESGEVAFINPAGLAIFGAGSLDELKQRSLVELVDSSCRDLFLSQLSLLQDSGVKVPWMEQSFTRCTGAIISVEVSGIPFLLEGRRAAQIIFRDITERKLAKERLEQMAHHDLLTGLPNRAFFFDRLNCLLEHARRYKDRFALLYLDLDGFKKVNDEMGHDAGDDLLKEMASRLEQCLRKADSVARLGGDEFIVLLSKVNERHDPTIVAKKIIAAGEAPFAIGGKICHVGVSVGIAVFPEDGDNVDILVKKADTAMYQAKGAGKSTYRYFGDAQH
jgi:diguanylate cyclase (GGDEF)-like protein/PAS domain S-box-containing protein